MHPDDFHLLEISVGAITGQFTNIDETGAPGMLYNSFPHIQEHDPYSGDYGLGFFGISLESGGYFVNHKDLGPICYLCDLELNSTQVTHETFATLGSGRFSLRDAYRQRFYFEPLGLWVQADAGQIDAVDFDMQRRTLDVTFLPAEETAAGAQSYSMLRLRVDKVARGTSRPGSNFTVSKPASGVVHSRAAWEIPPPASAAAAATVTISWVV